MIYPQMGTDKKGTQKVFIRKWHERANVSS
jgi:hypothetical protein